MNRPIGLSATERVAMIFGRTLLDQNCFLPIELTSMEADLKVGVL